MLKIPIKFRKILKARLGSFLKKLKLGSARQKVGSGASLQITIYVFQEHIEPPPCAAGAEPYRNNPEGAERLERRWGWFRRNGAHRSLGATLTKRLFQKSHAK